MTTVVPERYLRSANSPSSAIKHFIVVAGVTYCWHVISVPYRIRLRVPAAHQRTEIAYTPCRPTDKLLLLKKKIRNINNCYLEQRLLL